MLMAATEADRLRLCTATDPDGYTCLHRAAYNGRVDVIKLVLQQYCVPVCLLIGSGASVHAVTLDGLTPLHSAANWDQHEVCATLCPPRPCTLHSPAISHASTLTFLNLPPLALLHFSQSLVTRSSHTHASPRLGALTFYAPTYRRQSFCCAREPM